MAANIIGGPLAIQGAPIGGGSVDEQVRNARFNSALQGNMSLYAQILSGYQNAMQNLYNRQTGTYVGHQQLANQVRGGINATQANEQARVGSFYGNASQIAPDQRSRGLSNPTINTRGGYAADRAKTNLALQNQMSQLRAGYNANLGTATLDYANKANLQDTALAQSQLNFMDTITAKYPGAQAYRTTSPAQQQSLLQSQGYISPYSPQNVTHNYNSAYDDNSYYAAGGVLPTRYMASGGWFGGQSRAPVQYGFGTPMGGNRSRGPVQFGFGMPMGGNKTQAPVQYGFGTPMGGTGQTVQPQPVQAGFGTPMSQPATDQQMSWLKNMYHFAKGGEVNQPTAIVGEGDPAYPEFVIPTDPKYKSRAMELWKKAGAKLGVKGMQEGGVLDRMRDQTRRVRIRPPWEEVPYEDQVRFRNGPPMGPPRPMEQAPMPSVDRPMGGMLGSANAGWNDPSAYSDAGRMAQPQTYNFEQAPMPSVQANAQTDAVKQAVKKKGVSNDRPSRQQPDYEMQAAYLRYLMDEDQRRRDRIAQMQGQAYDANYINTAQQVMANAYASMPRPQRTRGI